MRTIVLTALAVLALAGCGNPSEKAARGAAVKPAPNKPSTVESTPEKAVADMIEGAATARPKGHYDIKGPGEGWNGTTASMVSIGRAMDDKAWNTKDSLCRAVYTYDDPSVGTLTGKPEIRIQDATHFEVEYILPETGGNFNRIKGDGNIRAELLEAGWVKLPSSTLKGKPMSEKNVAAWPRRFSLIMFSQLVEGADSWGPLFQAWEQGVGGYQAVFEEQTFEQGGERAAHYRVYARTTQGNPTTIEVIIDKEHLRPLTVKVDGTLADGRKYNIFWTGNWFAGGKYDKGAFAIPPTVPRPAKAT